MANAWIDFAPLTQGMIAGDTAKYRQDSLDFTKQQETERNRQWEIDNQRLQEAHEAQQRINEFNYNAGLSNSAKTTAANGAAPLFAGFETNLGSGMNATEFDLATPQGREAAMASYVNGSDTAKQQIVSAYQSMGGTFTDENNQPIKNLSQLRPEQVSQFMRTYNAYTGSSPLTEVGAKQAQANMMYGTGHNPTVGGMGVGSFAGAPQQQPQQEQPTDPLKKTAAAVEQKLNRDFNFDGLFPGKEQTQPVQQTSAAPINVSPYAVEAQKFAEDKANAIMHQLPSGLGTPEEANRAAYRANIQAELQAQEQARLASQPAPAPATKGVIESIPTAGENVAETPRVVAGLKKDTVATVNAMTPEQKDVTTQKFRSILPKLGRGRLSSKEARNAVVYLSMTGVLDKKDIGIAQKAIQTGNSMADVAAYKIDLETAKTELTERAKLARTQALNYQTDVTRYKHDVMSADQLNKNKIAVQEANQKNAEFMIKNVVQPFLDSSDIDLTESQKLQFVDVIIGNANRNAAQGRILTNTQAIPLLQRSAELYKLMKNSDGGENKVVNNDLLATSFAMSKYLPNTDFTNTEALETFTQDFLAHQQKNNSYGGNIDSQVQAAATFSKLKNGITLGNGRKFNATYNDAEMKSLEAMLITSGLPVSSLPNLAYIIADVSNSYTQYRKTDNGFLYNGELHPEIAKKVVEKLKSDMDNYYGAQQ